MARVVIIDESTGTVLNVCELVRDADGLHPHWPAPEGCILIDNEVAGIGWTWDGADFIAPDIPGPPRLEILMEEGPATLVYNEVTGLSEDRPADAIAADKAELLVLLHAKLTDTASLTWGQMNKMLALERES